MDHPHDSLVYLPATPIGQDRLAVLNVLDHTPNPLSQLLLRNPEPRNASSSMGSQPGNKKPATPKRVDPTPESIYNHEVTNYQGLHEQKYKLHQSVRELLKSYLQVLQEMYTQQQQMAIFVQESKVQERLRENRTMYIEQVPNPFIEEEENYSAGIRNALIELEKENMSLRALSESQQMEIQQLIYQLEQFSVQLQRSQTQTLPQPQQLAPVSRYEEGTLRKQQYQDKLMHLNSLHQRKEQKMMLDIEQLVNENTSLIGKYNQLIDQLRQMQSTLEQLSKENQSGALEKAKLEDMYSRLRGDYDRLVGEQRMHDAAQVQGQLNSIFQLEETLRVTREELVSSQMQILQLRDQLNAALIQASVPVPQLDVSKLQETLLKCQSDNERLQQKLEGGEQHRVRVSQLEAQLEAERYLTKQLEMKVNQLERQVMEGGYERERIAGKHAELEARLMSLYTEQRSDGLENQKRIFEAKVASQEQIIQQLKDSVNRLEYAKRDLEQQLQRASKEIEQARERVNRIQSERLNDIGELKRQLEVYYAKHEDRYRAEKQLSNQKSKLEETIISLNRTIIEKDKQLSLSLIERSQLQEQVKEREMELDRARSRTNEADLLKQQLQYQIALIEQTKLRELELQRRVYDLENRNDDIQITHSRKTLQSMMI